ncbi:MAG: hypothetical protein M1832_001424 [Thelocarpon impressellum]|nr:MAG: hypothetical protein M1832_001424 [Thelocarpon impressellum]
MLFSASLVLLAGTGLASALSLQTRQSADAAGYSMPESGIAATTQFNMGSEFGGGTSCGANAFADGSKGGGAGGSGPGYLYAAINQLAFGANPQADAGGPGAACGVCYQITPIDANDKALCDQAMVFKIVDECPVSAASTGVNNCNQCKVGDVNTFGFSYHFDIAVDAMNQKQYDLFFKGVTQGSNWLKTRYQKVACVGPVDDPPINSWGCLSNCKNNDQKGVCATS